MKIKSFMMVLVAAFAAAVQAAPLAGQAGSETVARAQAPQQVVNPKPTPAVAPQTVEVQASEKDAIDVGVIETVALVGPEEFISDEKVSDLLTGTLCDGTVKKVGDLRAAFASVKQELVNRGYYLAYVFPAKADAYDAATKTLEVRVEPGRVGKITVKRAESAGNWYSDEQILKRFKYLKEGEPFNYGTLRQAFRAVNGHPDLLGDLNVEIRNGNTNNAPENAGLRYLDAELTVDDSFPLHATLDINNYAMEELGYWQAILALQYLNLTGADDVLTVSPGVCFNGSLWSIAGSYVRPFDWLRGGNWSVYGGYSSLNTDEVISRTFLEGVGGFAGLNTSWNLYDDEKRNVAFNLGVMWRYIKDQWEVTSQSLQKRDINIVPLTAGFSYADKRRDWLGGLDFASWSETVNLYADRDRMRSYSEDADGNYVIMRANWMRLQPLFGPKIDGEEWRCWNLFTKVEGQWSQGSTLITAERLALGGYSCMRGYRCRGYLGDSGLYGTVEFRTPVWTNPISGLFSDELKTAIERFQLFVFSDMGGLWYNNSYIGMDQDEFLWSAGFGCRAALTQYLSLNFDFAVPLVKGYASDYDRGCEVYIGVKMQY